MSLGPNLEQRPAIEHFGGVLLKAGAGSGKTFVLTYHLLHLVSSYIEEFKNSDELKTEDSFRSFIRTKLSKIVLMTFTNKAAGEISTRIVKRFDEASLKRGSEGLDFDVWSIVTNSFDRLFVGTIHGFCFRLIKDGYVEGVDSNSEIISDAEFNDYVERLFENWLELKIEDYLPFKELIVNEKSKILSTLKSVLSDAALRVMWEELDVASFHKEASDEAIKFILEKNLSFDLKMSNLNLEDVPSKYHDKSWFELLKAFDEFRHEMSETFSGFIKTIKFFQPWHAVSLRKPSAKDVSEEVKEIYEEVKKLKDLAKSYQDDFLIFDEKFEEHVKPWVGVLKDIIVWVQKEYQGLGVLTFTDLEYNVWKSLQNEEIKKLIQKKYEYFVIDEFQDTSYIQYEMIQNLIGNDFKKLFCVGDAKQAIYGFRGGEIKVFTDCEKAVPTVLSMANNFRSYGNVIEFNNVFFDFLFKLGQKFEGIDKHSVEVLHQKIPEGKESKGIVSKVKINLEKIHLGEEGSSLSNRVVEYLEALALIKKIQELRNENEKAEIAILYSKLKASEIMVELLMKNDIGFTAQVKVPFGEDPIVGIFYTLVSYEFNKNQNKKEFRDFFIKSYLKLLQLEKIQILEDDFDKFESDTKFYGMKEALRAFFFKLGISNSNSLNNLKKLEVIIDLCQGQKNKIFKTLNIDADNRYSIDFQYGKNPHLLQIMTAHASKGLEFKHVLCGGIYTNGQSINIYPEIGNFPGSFQWSLNTKKGNRFKTPILVFERLLQKEKEFSEAKRLFYVVGTRAEESLTWVEIDFSHYKTRIASDSWINGIRAFEDDVKDTNLAMSSKVNKNSKEYNIEDDIDLSLLESMSLRTPLFHKDSLGVEQKVGEETRLGIIPEMAITKLATIVDCPRKFYLKNTLKFEEEKSEPKELKEEIDTDSFESIPIFKNSAQRGTDIHNEISQIILSQFVQESSGGVVKRSIERVKQFRDTHTIYSETELKFEIFHMMLTGIPDMYLISKSDDALSEVWDFKTGRQTEEKNRKYLFQLSCYAEALYQKGFLSPEKQIKLVIYYVDFDEMVERIISSSELREFLWNYWAQINRPELYNLEHCSQCAYGNICNASKL